MSVVIPERLSVAHIMVRQIPSRLEVVILKPQITPKVPPLVLVKRIIAVPRPEQLTLAAVRL